MTPEGADPQHDRASPCLKVVLRLAFPALKRGNLMNHLAFDSLIAAVTKPAVTTWRGKRLRPADAPNCFVAPPLEPKPSNATTPFHSELVFVEASAAVGKSTMARYLSAKTGAPLLDLAVVPVASQSLAGLIQTDVAIPDALSEFEAGRLPIIVDALDEGRLLSGEPSFDGFLESTGELLARNQSVVDRPKLIIFGRPEAIELAQISLDLYGNSPTATLVQVGFFDERAGRELVHAYAKLASPPDGPYYRFEQPANELISAFFDAIALALGVQRDQLWADPVGHAFAGYAPVLSALGTLLAELDNFSDVTNKLRDTGTQRAWGVINVVLGQILRREQGKVCDQLQQAISVPPPPTTYDTEEQLTFLAQFAHGRQLRATGRVSLTAQDHAKYTAMVETAVRDHPFVRKSRLDNPVLASVVLAHALANDLIGESGQLERAARHPFLWRSLEGYLTPDLLVDGSYLGLILNSFWSDPTSVTPSVEITSDDDASARVVVRWNSSEREFRITLPATLYGEARQTTARIQGDLVLRGSGTDAESAFHIVGPTSLASRGLQVSTSTILFDSNVRVHSDGPPNSTGRLDLKLKPGAAVGWSGAISATYPWSTIPSTLPPEGQPDALASFLSACAGRFGTTPMTLHSDYSVADNDPHMKWAERSYPGMMQRLARSLVKHGLAQTAPISARGSQGKIAVHLKTPWASLVAAATSTRGAAEGALTAVIAELRD